MRHQVIDCLRLMIKGWDRRHDHRSGLLRAHHVFEMDAIERRITNAENQTPAFFERHIRGTGNEIVASAAGHRGERSHRARYDAHRIRRIAAGGDGSANVRIRKNFNLASRLGATRIEHSLRQFGKRPGDVQFVFEQAQAGFGDDQMNACHARIGIEHSQSGLRQDGARSACNGDDNDFAFR